ncbi:MAG: T9SS type A sorting domain-containing protein [Bacteroidota bacterium]
MKSVLSVIVIFLGICGSLVFGQSWISLGDSLHYKGSGSGGEVRALGVFQNQLFVGGDFNRVGDSVSRGVVVWDGMQSKYVTFHNWDSTLGQFNVEHFVEYRGEWLVGGGFADLQLDGTAMCARWDGTTVVGNTYSQNGSVGCMLPVGNELYISGFFIDQAGPIFQRPFDKITRFDGQQYFGMQGLGTNGYAYSMVVFNGNIVVAGSLPNVNGAASWNGTSWQTLGLGVNGTVFDMAVYKGELYIAGSFGRAGNAFSRGIAKWDGNNWQALGTGLAGSSANGLSLHVHNNELYVGGDFTFIGGVSATNIAKYDGTTWSSVGQGISKPVTDLETYQGELHAVTARRPSNQPSYLWKFGFPTGIDDNLGENSAPFSWSLDGNRMMITLSGQQPGTDWRMTLIDLQGKTVHQENLQMNQTEIPAGHLSKGIYLIQVSNGQENWSQKVILN